MKQFKYRIYDTVYDDIVSGKKTIEFRLLNDKSKDISKGDQILFIVENDDEKKVLVEVTNKYIYSDLDELWNSNDSLDNILNYSRDEFINAFYDIFGKEVVNNSKIVGIEFKLKHWVGQENNNYKIFNNKEIIWKDRWI